MTLLAIFQWLQSTEVATALRESSWVYPIVMATHLSGMALFGGMILITDMRLLGLVMRGSTVSDVVGGLRPWKHFGLLLTATCGIFLALSKAEFYYHNPFFWCKLALLLLVIVHALVFRNSVYRNTAAIDRAPVIPANAKVGSSWADTITAAASPNGQAVDSRTITTSRVAGDTAYAGQKAWRVERSIGTTIKGTVDQGGQQFPVEGNGTGSASFYVSQSGVYLGSTMSQKMTITSTAPDGTPQPITQTAVSKTELIP